MFPINPSSLMAHSPCVYSLRFNDTPLVFPIPPSPLMVHPLKTLLSKNYDRSPWGHSTTDHYPTTLLLFLLRWVILSFFIIHLRRVPTLQEDISLVSVHIKYGKSFNKLLLCWSDENIVQVSHDLNTKVVLLFTQNRSFENAMESSTMVWWTTWVVFPSKKISCT